MTDAHDFDEQLGKAPSYRLPDSVKQHHLDMLAKLARTGDASEVNAGGQGQHRKNRRRLVVVAVAVVVTAAAGVGTAAALGLFTAEPPDRRIATCYATTDLNAADNHFDIAVATPDGGNPNENDAASSAMDICTGAWQQGRLSTTDPKVREDPQDPPWDYPVPALVACVLPSGEVGVLPGPAQLCGDLGLPIADV